MASFVVSFRARAASRLAAIAVISAGIAGCSADITRFDDNPFTGSVAGNVPPAPIAGHQPSSYGSASSAPAYGSAGPAYGHRVGQVSSQPLPPMQTASAPLPPPAASYPGRQTASAAYSTPHVAPAAPASVPHQGSATHVVVSGETLFGIARKYGKPHSEIARANGLAPAASLRIGQRLVIPGVAQQRIRTASLAPGVPSQASAPPTRLVTRKPTALPQEAPARTAAPAAPVTTPRPATAAASSSQAEPVATARLASPAADAAAEAKEEQPSATGAISSFRWPVRGRVIAGFGPKPNGQRNEGINLAVPEGTSVKAAEDGVVAYAGNELKGYGNLVLVRHSGSYVTAYAHASELKVKRGDKVKRGQIIALAGQTGGVSSPQLHFEIRKGSTPVDPMQYMANN